MKLGKQYATAVFLVVMVGIMVVVMSLFLGSINGAFEDGLWPAWPRQSALAFVVALPAAVGARWVALRVVKLVTA